MAGISYKALMNQYSENKRGYNGNELQNKEFGDGNGLELYDFNARTYDPQIGRFLQVDPETEGNQESWTPYHFGFDSPVLQSDPDGKNPIAPIVWAYRAYRVYRAIQTAKEIARALKTETPQLVVTPMVITQNEFGQDVAVKQDKLIDQYLGVLRRQQLLAEGKKSEEADPSGGTYVLEDEEGNVQRTGRTKDLERREKEHARGEETKDLEFEVDTRTNDKKVQRGREQQLHDKHDPPLNKIKPIRDNHPDREELIQAAVDYIKYFTIVRQK